MTSSALRSLKAERFLTVPHRFTLGLQSIQEDEWLSPLEAHAVELELKAALLDGAERAQVLAALPGSEAAQAELLDHVHSSLCRQTRRQAEMSPASSSSSALERAGRLVSEDLLIMEQREARWVLTAACVCFPSRWDLHEKMGKTMDGIHEPVPGLNARLGSKVTKLFDSLAPGKIVARMNSDVMDSPDLYQPPSYGAEVPTPAPAPCPPPRPSAMAQPSLVATPRLVPTSPQAHHPFPLFPSPARTPCPVRRVAEDQP